VCRDRATYLIPGPERVRFYISALADFANAAGRSHARWVRRADGAEPPILVAVSGSLDKVSPAVEVEFTRRASLRSSWGTWWGLDPHATKVPKCMRYGRRVARVLYLALLAGT